MFGHQAPYKSNPGTAIFCSKWGASGQEKIQYIKYVHCQITTAASRLQTHAPASQAVQHCCKFSKKFTEIIGVSVQKVHAKNHIEY